MRASPGARGGGPATAVSASAPVASWAKNANAASATHRATVSIVANPVDLPKTLRMGPGVVTSDLLDATPLGSRSVTKMSGNDGINS